MRSTIIQNATNTLEPDAEPPNVALHFETRLGKRRWQDRESRTKREGSP